MNVVVPFDLTPVSERALDHAVATYGPRGDVRIHAVHFGDSAGTVEDLARAGVEKRAGDVAATVETRFVSADGDGDVDDDPGEVARRILEVARELDAHAIVVGYHEKGPVESFLSGNTATHLVERGARPVTVVQ